MQAHCRDVLLALQLLAQLEAPCLFMIIVLICCRHCHCWNRGRCDAVFFVGTTIVGTAAGARIAVL